MNSTKPLGPSISDSLAPAEPSQAHPTVTLLAYGAIYFVWGTTFFAMRVGIESIPPLLVPAMRHLVVGLIFYPVFRILSREKPTLSQWTTCAVVGILLLTVANGTVITSEKVVPSGIAALLVSTVSLWMVLLDWLRPGGTRPVPRVFVGLFLGFAGMVLLVGPKNLGGSGRINPVGAVALVLASLSWAFGSVYSKHHPLPNSPLLGVAMQCLSGGTALVIAAFFNGQLRSFHVAQVTTRSWMAVIYLAIFGSGIGLSSYVYLLKHSSASHVSTYAFVNPVVALLVGWWLGGEVLSLRTMIAIGIILSAVLIVITAPHRSPEEADEALPAPGEA
jgi:drug/metabolite transporter (DMT)-like permease